MKFKITVYPIEGKLENIEKSYFEKLTHHLDYCVENYNDIEVWGVEVKFKERKTVDSKVEITGTMRRKDYLEVNFCGWTGVDDYEVRYY